MTIVKTLGKGQIVIPKAVREKYGIRPGTKLALTEEGERIVLSPLPEDPIEALHGMFKDGPSLTEELLRSRREDHEREERKIARFSRTSEPRLRRTRQRKGRESDSKR